MARQVLAAAVSAAVAARAGPVGRVRPGLMDIVQKVAVAVAAGRKALRVAVFTEATEGEVFTGLEEEELEVWEAV